MLLVVGRVAARCTNAYDGSEVKYVPSAAAVVRHLSRRPYESALRDCQRFYPFVSRCMCVRVTRTSRVCSYLAESRWLPWLRVSKRSVRFGFGCSEMSGAKDSKAVLSC